MSAENEKNAVGEQNRTDGDKSSGTKQFRPDGKKTKGICLDAATVLLAAIMSALGFHVFVYPAEFAPAGMDGVATMLQKITGLNAGWYMLMLNAPLLIAALFVLKNGTLSARWRSPS